MAARPIGGLFAFSRAHAPVDAACLTPGESPSLLVKVQATGVSDMPSTAKKTEQASVSPSVEPLAHLTDAADAMHAALVKRADDLMGCVEGSPEEKELATITDALEAYEAQLWPLGKIPRRQGLAVAL